MSRKHDNLFNYYGYRYAPEQWRFFYNDKPIRLDEETKSRLAIMYISGGKKKVEDELKRILRKEEKRINDLVTFGFYAKNSKDYYLRRNLTAHRENIKEKLCAYKQLKKYITERNNRINIFVVTTGYITPDGVEARREEDKEIIIDMDKPGCVIRCIKKGIFE